MPKWPPTARGVGQRGVVRVAGKKMAIITAIREIRRGGKEGLGQVDLNKVPTGPESAGRSVGDKEETVRGEKDCSVKG